VETDPTTPTQCPLLLRPLDDVNPLLFSVTTLAFPNAESARFIKVTFFVYLILLSQTRGI
jgi:hypothetical protein